MPVGYDRAYVREPSASTVSSPASARVRATTTPDRSRAHPPGPPCSAQSLALSRSRPQPPNSAPAAVDCSRGQARISTRKRCCRHLAEVGTGRVVPVPESGLRGDCILGYAFPKQAMEMTEYGKHGKPRGRLSTLPTLLGNPFAITTFPGPRLLAYFKVARA